MKGCFYDRRRHRRRLLLCERVNWCDWFRAHSHTSERASEPLRTIGGLQAAFFLAPCYHPQRTLWERLSDFTLKLHTRKKVEYCPTTIINSLAHNLLNCKESFHAEKVECMGGFGTRLKDAPAFDSILECRFLGGQVEAITVMIVPPLSL